MLNLKLLRKHSPRCKGFFAAGAIACLIAAGGAARAQEVPGAPGESPASADEGNKFSFHAFINQAYAKSQDHQIYGIPTDGTTDYENIALQLRYDFTKQDTVVVQLAHDRFGRSPLNEVTDDVELDFAFYQHRFKDETLVKLGKIPLPFGIYNEIQDVGTILPFFTAPESVYLKSHSNESFEGALAGHTFAPNSKWSLDAELYAGGWDRVEQSFNAPAVVVRAENGLGTQLWLSTPLPGVRLGAGVQRWDFKGDSLEKAGEKGRAHTYVLSFDGNWDRFFVRAEYYDAWFPLQFGPVLDPKFEYIAYYGQVGFAITPKLKINAQAERARIGLNLGSPATEANKDYALGLAYAFSYNVVAKIEGHKNTGILADEAVFTPLKTTYGLASISVSF